MMVQHYTNMSQIQKLNGQSHPVNGKFESSEKQNPKKLLPSETPSFKSWQLRV